MYLYLCACRDVLGSLSISFFLFCFQGLKTLFLYVGLDMPLFFVVTSFMISFMFMKCKEFGGIILHSVDSSHNG